MLCLFLGKNDYLGGWRFSWIFFGGFTSNFDNFWGLYFKVNYSNLCSLCRNVSYHTTQLSLMIMGKIFYDDILGFAKKKFIFFFFFFFLGGGGGAYFKVLIFFGVFCWVRHLWGCRTDDGAKPM